MDRTAGTRLAWELMQEFALATGLDPPGPEPRRYLWTDAFAVCNYLGLFLATGDPAFRELALRLIGQVHHTLGRFRSDDTRSGWISGLPPEEGELHPAVGGLRIGKPLPERPFGEPYDEQQEWDRDGQYFHYLTHWMHALRMAGRITGKPVYTAWAVELARASHAAFTYQAEGRTRMYWKMSTDLSRPLVLSMGQHDPLDGLVTYAELRMDAGTGARERILEKEVEDLEGMVRDMSLETDDPLGIGGLLTAAARIARLVERGSPVSSGLLGPVTSAALAGLGSFSRSRCLRLPARYRLAFRELGLSIGLAGIESLGVLMGEKPFLFAGRESTIRQIQALQAYVPLRGTIEEFWLAEENRESVTWTGHREINTVMLATSLAPGGYLEFPRVLLQSPG
jgi:hypothetical protein